jgi:hypothetical protein
MMSCLCSCSQSHDIAGEYETKSGAVRYLLKLYPSGAFHFDSYNEFKQGLPAEPSISGRGTWNAENDVIYFRTNPDTDLDHNYTLNFNDTMAKFKNDSSKNVSNEKAIAKLEFFESGIFWINGIELKKRN